MIRWLKNTGEDRDVIVSSRIRLARNLDDYFFPIKISQNDATILNNEVVSVIQSEKYEYFRIKDMPSLESKMLIEKHIISPALIQKSDISGFVMSKDETETIMINEEDHIRIQVIDSGLSLLNAWIKANE